MEDNIKMDLEEIRWSGVDTMYVIPFTGQGRVAGYCEHDNGRSTK